MQFRATPPLEVHKPLRTVSPPSKMLGLGSPPHQTNSRVTAAATLETSRNNSSETITSARSVRNSNSGVLGSSRDASEKTSVSSNSNGRAELDGCVAGGLRAASPRKRHRHTPRHHNRPSLDFEKMQQVRSLFFIS